MPAYWPLNATELGTFDQTSATSEDGVAISVVAGAGVDGCKTLTALEGD